MSFQTLTDRPVKTFLVGRKMFMQRKNVLSVFAICFLVNLMTVLIAGASLNGMVWKYAGPGMGDAVMQIVEISPGSPEVVYAGSANVVYKTVNSGETWNEMFSFGASGNVVNAIAISPENTQIVYVCTGNGLYRSGDGGLKWDRVFSGIGDKEGDVRSIAISPEDTDVIYIGTRAGMFLTENSGKGWKKARSLPDDIGLYFILIDRSDPDIVYTAADRGIYKSLNRGVSWSRVYEVYSSNENGSLPDEDEQYENNEIKKARGIKGVTAGPGGKILYAGSSKGLLVSIDRGSTWKNAGSLGLPGRDIRHLVADPADANGVYAATGRGVFRYSKITESWDEIYKGLVSSDIRYLASAPSAGDRYIELWAATDKGIFKLVHAADTGNSEAGEEKVFHEFSHEPSIAEIREAAIEYAEVNSRKIYEWRKAAARRAFLPDVRFEYQKNRDWQSSTYFYSTSSEKYKDDDITEGRDKEWSVSLTWELGDLIWNNDQTSIDSRSRLVVQLRDDVLNEVTRLYFERRRLQIEMLMSPRTDVKEKIEKELRLQELTANIDALTGSYLSRRMGQKNY
jgi:photosystem II stability/assembly factor-like uncharacterized protein